MRSLLFLFLLLTTAALDGLGLRDLFESHLEATGFAPVWQLLEGR